jgi:hypothetical protein
MMYTALRLPWPPPATRYFQEPSHAPWRVRLFDAGKEYRETAKAAWEERKIFTTIKTPCTFSLLAYARDKNTRSLPDLFETILDALLYAKALESRNLIWEARLAYAPTIGGFVDVKINSSRKIRGAHKKFMGDNG